jgi:hypoxanthine-guanine phosphoribosyltransferase
MKYNIFLSYSHLDRALALELEQKFSASGLRCFLSEKDLTSGVEWVERIKESIRESEYVMLLITPRSVKSPWIFVEAGAAWMENKRIIPLIQFVDISELPEIIKGVQIKNIETEVGKLALVQELANVKESDQPVKISLDFIFDQVRLAKSKMDQEQFEPNLFVGSGRGGAICAALFSQHFGHLPLKVVDCHHMGKGADRTVKIDDSSLKKEDILDKNVLVIEWKRQTGKTFHAIQERLKSLGPASVQSYALFWTKQNNVPPDFYGILCDSAPNPWGIN